MLDAKTRIFTKQFVEHEGVYKFMVNGKMMPMGTCRKTGEINERGRIAWTAYCEHCGEKLPEYEEAMKVDALDGR